MRSILLLFLSVSIAHADLRLPAVISDHMVVQADTTVKLWGWADAGENIRIEFADQVKSTRADAEGKWSVKLDARNARNEPLSMSIIGKNIAIVRDVLIGEVWLASGQSNMEMTVKDKQHGSVDNADAEIASATHPQIRMFLYDSHYSIYESDVPPDEELQNQSGKWIVCSPETVGSFSAMGYFFARDLLHDLKRPIGILSASVGGTPIESWTSSSAQRAIPELQPILDDWTKRLSGFVPENEKKKFLDAKAIWLTRRSAAMKASQVIPKAPPAFKNLQVMKPGGLFNALIAPLMNYSIRGVIWYQGERNAAGPFTGLYGVQLKTLIEDWRTRFSDDCYFAWVQLPGFSAEQRLPSEPNGWGVAVRDEMRRTLSVPRTSMAITIDLGGVNAGHPTNKVEYANRLSRVVLHDVYQKEIAVWNGPLFNAAQIDSERITLHFDHANGLKAKSEILEGFAIAGSDQKFVWANAEIENNRVVVRNNKIHEPKAVRYAWAGNPKGNLVNEANLPASPFRTDDWK